MQQLPDADGGRSSQTHAASSAIPGSCLWSAARSGGSLAGTHSRSGAAMMVLLFARARDLIGADRIAVESAATVGDVRRQLVQQYPQIAGLLEKSAFAVTDEFADD